MRISLRQIAPVAVAAAAVLVVPALVFAWGDAGHRMIGEAAARALPSAMPAFFRNASRQLGYLNPEPDRWRDRAESSIDPALDRGSAPDHFIDMEMVSPTVLAAALSARDRYGYLDTIATAHANGVAMGLLPFKMLEMSQQLREDFRQWRAAPDSVKAWVEARIVDDAGILGHYVADGSNPAHTSIQFNGWTGPNPNGYATDKQFHARFESGFVREKVRLADVMTRVDTSARVFPDLRAAIVAYLRETNTFVEPLYKLDKAHPFDTNTTAIENKAFAADRLAAGARMLRDIWWTAWVTSAPSGTDASRHPAD
jgi:hypothetical protein